MEKTTGQIEDLLKDLGNKIDSLIEEGKQATGQIREDLDVQIEALKKKRDELDGHFTEYREKGKEKWEEAKPHLDTAVNELKVALDKFFKGKKD